MGKISKVLYGQQRDNTEWETDKEFFKLLNERFNFTLDCCATSRNRKCKKYYSKLVNALTKKWIGRVFMNPPYGKNINLWIKKAYLEVKKGNADIVVCLIPVRTDSQWFCKYSRFAQIVFLAGRLKFGMSGVFSGTGPFGSMLLIFRKNWEGRGTFKNWDWRNKTKGERNGED